MDCRFSPVTEMLLAMSATPAALCFLWLFFRGWHRAIAETPALGPESVEL
jgi:hypothetical protein